jgi:prophage antirepressor-like protein
MSWRRFTIKLPQSFRAPTALFVARWRASNSSVRAIMTKEKDIKRSTTEQNNGGTGFLLKILLAALASDSANRAQAAILSPSTAARAAWEATKAASRRLVSWVAIDEIWSVVYRGVYRR